MLPVQMTPFERRAAISLAGIFALRMLGLFMILPVFSLYADSLENVTPTLVGAAIGAYGLTQALLQIPFGMLSDRLGRKPVITAGLLIFAAGSAMAAMATSIEGVIIGRALQGAGAIAAAVMALAADLTREEHRTTAMAVIGMSIGMSFIVAMVGGPVLNHWIGVPGIFWLTAVLALAGIVILHFAVPNPREIRFHRDTEPVPGQFGQVLRDTQLLRLDFGILVLHLVLSATFVALPLALRDGGFTSADHWMLYLPVMVSAMGAAVPFIIIAEKKRSMKLVVNGAIALLAIAELALAELHQSLLGIAFLLWLFFTAFNLLEATLPSLIAKITPADSKGTAMGVYSSSQFIGVFIGGLTGGWFYEHYGFVGVFSFSSALVLVWLVLASTMREPPYLSTSMLNLGQIDSAEASALESALAQVRGVAEAVVHVEDGIAYLKVDKHLLDTEALKAFSVLPRQS